MVELRRNLCELKITSTFIWNHKNPWWFTFHRYHWPLLCQEIKRHIIILVPKGFFFSSQNYIFMNHIKIDHQWKLIITHNNFKGAYHNESWEYTWEACTCHWIIETNIYHAGCNWHQGMENFQWCSGFYYKYKR